MRLKEPIFGDKIPSNSGLDDKIFRIGRLRWILRTHIFQEWPPEGSKRPSATLPSSWSLDLGKLEKALLCANFPGPNAPI